ncbi:MAG: hypothetical protein HDR11_00845 [Lachnospiraceae bacterium]|nr:hypothetical protein [Lachnospiraceae bacterium]
MKKVILMIGGCQYNRGSEAMVRGCIKTLRSGNPDIQLVLSSRDDNTGNSLKIEGVDKYIKRFTYNRNNKLLRYSIGVLRYILHIKHWTNWINHSVLLKECREADLVIVVGGDNYDKAYGAFADMHSFNKTLKKTIKGKMVFLNCSLNPDEISNAIIKDLLLFDKVTAREQITYAKLKGLLPEDKLEYYPDIAFAMEPERVELPTCFLTGDVIGINLSPLILKGNYTDKAEMIMQEYNKIVEYIVTALGKQVLLIPHVMCNADLSVLRKIYERYQKNDRVFLLENEGLTSPEIKYIISNCYMYFGARTHSTIAAYSTCVPTLVLGYSVKSIGIARDIFGKEKGYVVPVQSISESEPDKLFEAFKSFAEEREQVLHTLKSVIPEYVKKANTYGDFFDKLIGV